MKSIKYVFDAGPIYYYIKYYPTCGERVKTKYLTNLVNSKSFNAKNFDFSFANDGYMLGDVEFKTLCFYCSNCKMYINVADMKRCEHKPKHK